MPPAKEMNAYTMKDPKPIALRIVKNKASAALPNRNSAAVQAATAPDLFFIEKTSDNSIQKIAPHDNEKEKIKTPMEITIRGTDESTSPTLRSNKLAELAIDPRTNKGFLPTLSTREIETIAPNNFATPVAEAAKDACARLSMPSFSSNTVGA